MRLGRLKRVQAAASLTVLVWAFATDARASSDDAVGSAQSDVTFVGRNMGGVQAAVAHAKTERRGPEQRLADGELLYRTNDYSRAIIVLSEILEEFPDTSSYPDALWLRGETYYAAHDYLAARRDYRALVDRGNEPRFSAYLGKALARLVDVVLRVNDPPDRSRWSSRSSTRSRLRRSTRACSTPRARPTSTSRRGTTRTRRSTRWPTARPTRIRPGTSRASSP